MQLYSDLLLTNLEGIDKFGIARFPTGVTQQKIQLRSGANTSNTIVVLSCITSSKLTVGSSYGYMINSNSELIIVTSSNGGDVISYLIKYI